MINPSENETGQLVPRHYQAEATNWLYNIKRGLLTDHPGLGKTLSSADAVELPCLVVAPKTLIGQWHDFLQLQYPNSVSVLADGTRKQRDTELSKVADWYVVNYEMLHSYAMPVNVKTIIFDESHHLRNRTALQSRAAYKLANRDMDTRVYMLSASPCWKNIDDIWHQLHILYPAIFTSYYEFINAFCVKIDTPYGVKVIGIKKAMRKELDAILSPIKMGRTYKDVGRELPTIIESVVKLTLSPALRKLYDDTKKSYRIKFEDEAGDPQTILFNAPALLHTLRQITCTKEKIDTIKELIDDSSRPTVVGTWYKDHALAIHKALPNSVLITGDIAGPERQRIAARAQQTKKHIVCTEASLTEGVNLSGYRQVIFAEEHYPPGANYQFLSRVVRDRNDKITTNVEPVLVYYVHARHTIDEVIHKVAKRRQVSIHQIIAEALV